MQGDTTFQSFHVDTIIDGELVLDREPNAPPKQDQGIPPGYVLKYLVFDCLVLDKKPLMHRTLDKRLAVSFPPFKRPSLPTDMTFFTVLP